MVEHTADASTAEPQPAAREVPSEEVRSALHADAIEVGYPTTDEPVVDVGRVDLPEGEITALVGPNGSGKSTLLRTLSGQLAPDSGAVVLDGSDVQSYGSKELARKLGLLSQENESPGSITVEELIYHGRYPHRGVFEGRTEADHAAVDRAIGLAGIDHLRETAVGNLSGGQKQLVWIAMVLAQDTDVLLLDEPTTFLDLRHQLRVMDVIQTLNEQRDVTVGVVLHDISQAARFADYVIALKDGDVYDWGPPTDVLTERLLADVFSVEAAVSYDPEIRITPKRALD
ncbi:ABC transporter ATP-binding protein [Halomicrobium urmianum]|uniref:ABC transporter ATP-binding protein n=1 Tax=Halomicrobium urmianum TaxID=1586233 RepID=UPI001CDA0772|nr:ABC transporter ATP-binding protein [Halomicrobium urmianum]